MLQRIKNNALTKLVSKNSKIIICVIAALVIALALIGYFRNYRRENFNADNSNPNFYMFYVDWCPHCKTTKPEFAACENSSVNFKPVNCEDTANADLISGLNIEGYPTLTLVKNGNKEYYDGERTKEGMEEWLSTKI